MRIQLPSLRSESAGFTLVELLVVTSLSVLLMLTATSVFITFMMSDARTQSIGQITEEGDYAMSQMEFLFRNAVEIEPNVAGRVCAVNMGQMRLRSFDNGVTTLGRSFSAEGTNRYVASNGARLTSEAVQLTDPAEISLPHNPTFSCRSSSDGRIMHITVEMVLEQPSVDFQDGSAINRESFTTGVTVRNR
jgi:Tfp pilus assembly protein FimT